MMYLSPRVAVRAFGRRVAPAASTTRLIVSLLLLTAMSLPATPASAAEQKKRRLKPHVERPEVPDPAPATPPFGEGDSGKTDGVVGNITGVKTVDKPTANPGDTLTYTVVVTNTTPSTPTSATFTDTIDANTTLVAGSV